jgi:hypothetical protein
MERGCSSPRQRYRPYMARRQNRAKSWYVLLVVAIATMLAACANEIRTSHDWDPTVDLSSYEAYAWISEDSLIPPKTGEGDVSFVSPIDDQRIRRAVDAELLSKGYRLAPSPDEADLVVSYGIGREEKIEVYESVGHPVGTYPRGHGYGYGGWYGGSRVRAFRYTEGTLTIELFDRATKQALWIGWGSKRLSDSDDREDVIQSAILKILEPLPVQGSSASQ